MIQSNTDMHIISHSICDPLGNGADILIIAIALSNEVFVVPQSGALSLLLASMKLWKTNSVACK